MFQACTSQTWTKCGSSLVIQSANCAISKNLSSSCKSLARIQSALEINPRNPPRATVTNASIGGALSKGATRVSPSLSRSRFNELCTRDTPTSRPAERSKRRSFLGLPLIFPASLRSLSGRQLAPVKNTDADQCENTAEQQNYLAKSQAKL